MTAQTPLPWEGQPYSIKRHGVSITNCDSEPVQTPGCVQAHGALLVLRPGTLAIAQASENTLAVLGHEPGALLGQSVGLVLGTSGEAQLRAFLAVEPIECNPLYVFSMDGAGERRLDVTVHANAGVLLLEFEATGRTGAAAAVEPDYYGLVRKTVVRLQGARTLQEFCDITTHEVRALTGLDRVMVYRFHEDGHGEVVAESRRQSIAPFLGLHYPAGDIPQPARQVFLQIWLRPTPDVSGALAEMVPLVDPDSGRALDMTHCVLRGASVMYTEYLKNMKVTAGLTMPIRHDGKLWGLIACHHYTGPRFIAYPVRAACEFLAQVASLQLRAAEDRGHVEHRLQLDATHQRLLSRLAQGAALSDIAVGDPGLLDAMTCGGAALLHAGRWTCAGNTPSPPQLDELAAWLGDRPEFESSSRPLYVSSHLAAAYPAGAAFAQVASGLLAVPLSRTQRSLILWFRPETMQAVHWGGNPDDKPTTVGPHGPRLTPRASFELFAQSVQQRALPWLAYEIDAIARLRVALLRLVVDKTRPLSMPSADLQGSNDELDAFAFVASHDLKEPLRGIHQYAHQLLESAPPGDAAAQQRLNGLLRLTQRMDGLIDSLLHFSRVGRVVLDVVACDLDRVVDEAIQMLGLRRDQTAGEFVRPRPLPTVQADWIRCREIYVNLLSNALTYSDQAKPRIETGWIAANEDRPHGCPPQALGQPIFFVRDNGIGIAPEHHAQVFKMFRRLHDRETYGGGPGVGLAIVKKLVERHRGVIWIDAAPGAGSTFIFTLPQREQA